LVRFREVIDSSVELILRKEWSGQLGPPEEVGVTAEAEEIPDPPRNP